MSNFSDFFPAAGGGGGFTKRLKYTTARGSDDADYNNAASYTVNPATDLGLEDGASLGYFMIGGGGMSNNNTSGARGGMIIQGIAIITSASTDLILTPGVGTPYVSTDNGSGYDNYATGAARQSTIAGGLSITTADGSNSSGYGGRDSGNISNAGPGVNGYGVGSVPDGFRESFAGYGNPWSGGNAFPVHGFGHAGLGVSNGYEGSDGAIILFY